jgi:hypothetical protein
MSDNPPTVNQIVALKNTEPAAAANPGLSSENRTLLKDALEAQIVKVQEQMLAKENDEHRLARVESALYNLEAMAEDRLVHVEKQTRGLAEAVIAITEIADTLAPAVKAVKDEMTGLTPPPLPRHLKLF